MDTIYLVQDDSPARRFRRRLRWTPVWRWLSFPLFLLLLLGLGLLGG